MTGKNVIQGFIMDGKNYYDVTKWHIGDPQRDIGEVLNSMISDVKMRQLNADEYEGGKPGAVIFIPSGDYHLRTQVVIDVSYLKIKGTGHGFESSSIRFNVPKEEWSGLHELWPGGSRILVDIDPSEDTALKPGGPASEAFPYDAAEAAGAAFLIRRDGDPRISSVEFEDFCIDGLHFKDDGSGDPENTYLNGKTGIYCASPNDSFRVKGMGMIYLEHGLTMYYSDALSIHDNFIAECGNCIELRGYGQASKVTDNLIGAGYRGFSIFAENFGGLLIAANNVFPRGKSIVHLSGNSRSSVTANRFHSFYPGMLIIDRGSIENLVSANHFLRDHEPWPPMQNYGSDVPDTYGLIVIDGSRNSVLSNHISETIACRYLKPSPDTLPVIIRVIGGSGNLISNNHITATTEERTDPEQALENSCFDAQVEAILAAGKLTELSVQAVVVEEGAEGNTILDSCRDDQAVLDRKRNAFRALPEFG